MRPVVAPNLHGDLHPVYTIALRHLVEQRADWSWTSFQIIDKKPTDY